MAEANAPLYALNRGIIDKQALARVDLSRTALSGDIQTNMLPQQLGPMMFRVGLEYQGTVASSNKAYHIPFVFSATDTAEIELTDGLMRVWVDNTLVSRSSNNTALLNGEFTTDLTGWTDNDDDGCTSDYSAGRMSLTGTGNAYARRYQQLNIAPSDTGKLHTLRVVVFRGPATLKIGSSLGSTDLLGETLLDEGTHSIQFLPQTTSAFIQLSADTRYAVLVDSATLESSGTFTLTAPWAEADLKLIRYQVSGQVVYVACAGYPPYVIERRQYGSWSIVKHLPTTGPYLVSNATPTTITPSALVGDITLTATQEVFSPYHVGSLMKLSSTGQDVTASLSDELQSSDHILVTGITTGRQFDVVRSGTWTGTVSLQRSVESPGAWITVATYTGNGTTTYDDDLDNQITYYRLHVESGNWTSGTADVELNYDSGFIDGAVRIDAVSSSTSATAHVVKALGGLAPTQEWAFGRWSRVAGYPSTVKLSEGRLWWFGKGVYDGSVSDQYDNHDTEFEGDAGPISRGIGFGAVDNIVWALDLQDLVIGTQSAELALRSSNDSETLTNANINVRGGTSQQGSKDVDAVRVDATGIFADRSNVRVYSIDYAFEPNTYAAGELTLLTPRLCRPGIERIAVQRKPNTRIHVVRSDGKVALCLFNKAEELTSWCLVETDGEVEDVVVIPQDVEDKVIYIVKRTIDGATVRYREMWSLEEYALIWTTHYVGESSASIEVDYENGTVVTVRDADDAKVENVTVADGAVALTTATTECYITPSLCKQSDSHVEYDGPPTLVLPGYDHLEGETVYVWADGKSQGSFTVSGGKVTLTAETVEKAVGGLYYRGRFRSTKLAYADSLGTGLLQSKKVSQLGILAAYTHLSGLTAGRDFNSLFSFPERAGHVYHRASVVHEDYDQEMSEFAGTYDTDSRVCLQAETPYPATIQGLVIGMETNDD